MEACGGFRESGGTEFRWRDRKSTRLNSSHLVISYAVFCLKKKKHFTTLRALRSLRSSTARSHVLATNLDHSVIIENHNYTVSSHILPNHLILSLSSFCITP